MVYWELTFKMLLEKKKGIFHCQVKAFSHYDMKLSYSKNISNTILSPKCICYQRALKLVIEI